jgi:hypothetical protein
MIIAKRVLMFIGLVVLASVSVSMLAPRATHAIVATLVQITNTSANPVATKGADNPALNTFQATFQSTCSGELGSISCSGFTI